MVRNLRITITSGTYKNDHGRSRWVFAPGDTVRGNLKFTITEAKSYENIQIKLIGEAKIDGTGSDSSLTAETCINEVVTLWNRKTAPGGKIGPGSFSFGFWIKLPPTIPHSMTTPMIGGRITYRLIGNINSRSGLLHGIGNARNSATEPLEIEVTAPVDIDDPYLRKPCLQSKHEPVGCLCLASTVGIVARMTHTGFCVGDTIPLVVEVTNGSPRAVVVRVSIAKIETSKAYRGRNSDYDRNRRLVVKTFTSPEIAPHIEYIWNAEGLTVPSDLQPSLTRSKYIQRRYAIQIAAVPRTPWPWYKQVQTEIPVTIGTVQMAAAVGATPLQAANDAMDYGGYMDDDGDDDITAMPMPFYVKR